MTEPRWRARRLEFYPPILVHCDGTSIWMNSQGQVAEVYSIRVRFWDEEDAEDPWPYLEVEHSNRHWEIYTDEGFEEAISDILTGYFGQAMSVRFTEQGMQDYKVASMEPSLGDTCNFLVEWVREYHDNPLQHSYHVEVRGV